MHICEFNFDALAQGNAHDPQRIGLSQKAKTSLKIFIDIYFEDNWNLTS